MQTSCELLLWCIFFSFQNTPKFALFSWPDTQCLSRCTNFVWWKLEKYFSTVFCKEMGDKGYEQQNLAIYVFFEDPRIDGPVGIYIKLIPIVQTSIRDWSGSSRFPMYISAVTPTHRERSSSGTRNYTHSLLFGVFSQQTLFLLSLVQAFFLQRKQGVADLGRYMTDLDLGKILHS